VDGWLLVVDILPWMLEDAAVAGVAGGSGGDGERLTFNTTTYTRTPGISGS